MVEWILQGAARILEESGYAALTTNRVAEIAGISVGSLYQYFPTKDAIVAELTRRHVEQALGEFRHTFSRWRSEPPTSLDDPVRHLVTLAVALNDPAHLHGALYDRGALSKAGEAAKALIVSELVDGVAMVLVAVESGGADPQRTAAMLVSATWSVVHEVVLAQPDEGSRLAALESWVAIVLSGLNAQRRS